MLSRRKGIGSNLSISVAQPTSQQTVEPLWQNNQNYHTDGYPELDWKKTHAQRLKDNLKVARAKHFGPDYLRALADEAENARRDYEGVVQAAEEQRHRFANISHFSTQPQQLQSSTNQSNPGPGPFGSTTLNNSSTQQHLQSSAARIDLEHLRPSTKYDQLTEALQRDLENAEGAIAVQTRHCEELEVALLPKIKETGALIPQEIEFIARKLESVQDGFGLDAEDEQYLEKWVVKKDAGELLLVGRNAERVKAPRQYQLGPGSRVDTEGGARVGGDQVFHAGLSGWWNNPQTLRGSLRAGTSTRGIQLPQNDDVDTEDYVDPSVKPPSSLVDLFERRADEMGTALAANRKMLADIEEYVEGVDDKVRSKEREMLDPPEYGYGYSDSTGSSGQNEKARQRKMLSLAFEEAHRSLYEVAARVSELREGLMTAATSG